jgi:hypothetical protein
MFLLNLLDRILLRVFVYFCTVTCSRMSSYELSLRFDFLNIYFWLELALVILCLFGVM